MLFSIRCIVLHIFAFLTLQFSNLATCQLFFSFHLVFITLFLSPRTSFHDFHCSFHSFASLGLRQSTASLSFPGSSVFNSLHFPLSHSYLLDVIKYFLHYSFLYLRHSCCAAVCSFSIFKLHLSYVF